MVDSQLLARLGFEIQGLGRALVGRGLAVGTWRVAFRSSRQALQIGTERSVGIGGGDDDGLRLLPDEFAEADQHQDGRHQDQRLSQQHRGAPRADPREKRPVLPDEVHDDPCDGEAGEEEKALARAEMRLDDHRQHQEADEGPEHRGPNDAPRRQRQANEDNRGRDVEEPLAGEVAALAEQRLQDPVHRRVERAPQDEEEQRRQQERTPAREAAQREAQAQRKGHGRDRRVDGDAREERLDQPFRRAVAQAEGELLDPETGRDQAGHDGRRQPEQDDEPQGGLGKLGAWRSRRRLAGQTGHHPSRSGRRLREFSYSHQEG